MKQLISSNIEGNPTAIRKENKEGINTCCTHMVSVSGKGQQFRKEKT